ncbi:MAG: family oxidoreductase [Solirubrobacteraceae bacterium]|nr:family oxidoreductase [Solirubrobacteraceae bacterium]
MDLGLQDKLCVVTGASRGIGLVTARRLCEEGARVLFVARDREALAEASADCGGDFLAIDITTPEAADEIIATCGEQMGGVDVLVNNAGTSRAVALDDLTDQDFDEQWQLHVLAPFRLMQEAAPRMAARGGGRIVTVSSSSGKRPGQRNVAYSVTKAAQLSLSRAFADRWASENVLVNAVTPGPVATELWTAKDGLAAQVGGADKIDETIAKVAKGVPLGRFAEPQEIADVIVFLCSARASTVTGAAWSADGGAVPVII